MKGKSDKKNKNSKNEAISWFFTIFPALIVLIVVILVGVVFDIVGVAVTCATEEEFHAMASKKVKGAKTAIKLIRSAPKVSNICADVIGDICGVLSGAISAILTLKITQSFGISVDIQFFMSALVASLTVGGKALGKNFAKTQCTTIIAGVSKVLSIFEKN